jgi:hypothetical protein
MATIHNPPRNLETLCALLQDGDLWVGAALTYGRGCVPEGAQDGDFGSEDLDWASLPTFGGEMPARFECVWSWDETRLLVGSRKSELEIVDRHEYE